jgi:hypothetical protein
MKQYGGDGSARSDECRLLDALLSSLCNLSRSEAIVYANDHSRPIGFLGCAWDREGTGIIHSVLLHSDMQ